LAASYLRLIGLFLAVADDAMMFVVALPRCTFASWSNQLDRFEDQRF
jgi:hypothetical protein